MKLLVLGARSWIGFRFAEAARGRVPGAVVVGTSSSPTEVFPDGSPAFPVIVPARLPDDHVRLVHSHRPDVVLNLLRGEDELGMAVHRAVAAATDQVGGRYVYASSAMALDGLAPDVPRLESTRPCAASDYGRFKGQCEDILRNEFPGANWQVLRFSSIQGWSPWKPSRNEAFLRKLVAAQPVVVDTGIVQNRLIDTVFASWAVDLALHPAARGTFHLGTLDGSEEHLFLAAVARDFGQDPALVIPGRPTPRRLDLDCTQARLLVSHGHDLTEEGTRKLLLKEPRLAPWIKKPTP